MRPQHQRAPAAIFVVAVLAGAALVSFRATYEPDLWWHLAQGREIAAGRFVRANLFSFTYPAYPQHYTSWLFDLGSYALWTTIGPTAVQGAQALAIALSLFVVAATCRLRSSLAATAAVCFLGWLIIEPRALPRPHVLSFLGLAACSYLVERARADRSWRPLRWMPLLIAVWANVHVECVFGVVIVGLFGAGELLHTRNLPRRDALRVVGIAAVSLVATLVNPYGVGLLRYLYENAFVPQVVNIAELLPPYLPNYRAFFVWSIAVGLVLLLRWRTAHLSDVLILAVVGYLGFKHLRMTPMFFLVSAPIVARAIDDLRRFRVDPRAVAMTAAAATLVLARVPVPAMVGELRVGRHALMVPEFFSAPAMQFARDQHLAGPVFTSMNLGGFVAWELYPSAQVFVDSRLQAYPPEHFRTIIEASKDHLGWQAITAGVDWAVVSLPRVNQLSGVGQFRPPEWRVAFEDRSTQILVRQKPQVPPLP
jgi:hypothetical protein